MPFKDPAKRNAYQAALGRNKRAAKLEAEKNAHPLGPLGWEGDHLIAKWITRGEYLLRKMILAQQWYGEHKDERAIYMRDYYVKNKTHIRTVNDQWMAEHQEENCLYKHQWYVENKPRLQKKAAIYYQAHKAIMIARSHAYYWTNRHEVLVKQTLRYLANREAILAKQHVYYACHREQQHAYEVQRYQRRRDAILARASLWHKTHPAEMAGYRHRRRLRVLTNGACDLSTEQWLEIQQVHKNRCVYCGKKARTLTIDHLTAVSNGGAHTAPNILPACRSCNSRKGRRGPLVPVQPFLLTMAPPRPSKATS